VSTAQPDPRAYMKLAALLRDQVASGELAPGDRLAMRVLCGKTGHSRQTVGKAMRVLEREGLIYRVTGLGYHVSYPEEHRPRGRIHDPSC
jgi:DNA-binding GntR family transcriptional regulator